MSAILELDAVRFEEEEEAFQDFFRSFERNALGSKYLRRLADLSTSHGHALVIDFEDLASFDHALARRVLERPDEYIDLARRAAAAQLRVVDPEHTQRITRIYARFRRLPEKTSLRHVGVEHLKKLISVDGIVVKSTQVRPIVVRAAYRCIKCAQMVREEEAGELVRGLGRTCPHCRQRTVFELVQSESEFRNTQDVRVQERPEDLPPGQLPRYLDVRLEDDLVDTAALGDSVTLTALVRAERTSKRDETRGRAFSIYLEANYLELCPQNAVVENAVEDPTEMDQTRAREVTSEGTLEQLKRLSPLQFQAWVITVKFGGRLSPRKSGDMGIDGYTSGGEPIQVKRSENVGRNVVDNFETAIRRRGAKKGIIVALGFSESAYREARRARTDGLEIRLFRVSDSVG